MYGITLKNRKMIRKKKRDDKMAMLKNSCEILNNLLCMRYMKLRAKAHIMVMKISKAKSIIVHHMKNEVSV